MLAIFLGSINNRAPVVPTGRIGTHVAFPVHGGGRLPVRTLTNGSYFSLAEVIRWNVDERSVKYVVLGAHNKSRNCLSEENGHVPMESTGDSDCISSIRDFSANRADIPGYF